MLAVQVVRPVALPDLEHHVDRLEEDRIAVLLVVPEHLGVRHQAARADPEDQPPLEQVVEHRDLCRDVAGCVFGMLIVPVPSRISVVRARRSQGTSARR